MVGAKSPIKDRPLRQAGQSGNDQLLDIIFGQLLSYIWITATLWVVAIVQWVQHLRQSPPAPVLITIFAAGVTAYSLARAWRLFKTAKAYKLGRDGEKVVGEYLDRLRAKGYRVYHDIPGKGWNIDHIAISTRGVFTIETKTRSKPEIGEPLVEFNGHAVSVNGNRWDERPIRQSIAQSKQLRIMLKEWTGRDYPVRGVVVYPGWYVQRIADGKESDIWVLNPKALHKWIDKEPESISTTEVMQAATALAKYIRGFADPS